jgi:hypothetical protein
MEWEEIHANTNNNICAIGREYEIDYDHTYKMNQ